MRCATCERLTFLRPLITGIGRDEFFTPMQYPVDLIEVVFVGGRGHQTEGQATFGSNAERTANADIETSAGSFTC